MKFFVSDLPEWFYVWVLGFIVTLFLLLSAALLLFVKYKPLAVCLILFLVLFPLAIGLLARDLVEAKK